MGQYDSDINSRGNQGAEKLRNLPKATEFGWISFFLFNRNSEPGIQTCAFIYVGGDFTSYIPTLYEGRKCLEFHTMETNSCTVITPGPDISFHGSQIRKDLDQKLWPTVNSGIKAQANFKTTPVTLPSLSKPLISAPEPHSPRLKLSVLPCLGSQRLARGSHIQMR